MGSGRYLLPISIIVTGILTAVAILMVRGDGLANSLIKAPTANVEKSETDTEIELRPVGLDDHIFGNPDAPVIIIEYGDFGCPYCAIFHETMLEIMSTYGKEGKVAWIFRHLPDEEHHANSTKTSQLSECIAQRLGENAFWNFADKIYSASRSTPANQMFVLHDQIINESAIGVGLNENNINACYEEKSFLTRVNSDLEEAKNLAKFDANFGTPYLIMLGKDGTKEFLAGAQEYSVIRSYIDLFLKI